MVSKPGNEEIYYWGSSATNCFRSNFPVIMKPQKTRELQGLPTSVSVILIIQLIVHVYVPDEPDGDTVVDDALFGQPSSSFPCLTGDHIHMELGQLK